jgi:hypothetical protein
MEFGWPSGRRIERGNAGGDIEVQHLSIEEASADDPENYDD